MNIIKTNGKYFFFSTADFMKKLEPGNYSLNFDAKGNLYLEDEDPFRLPAKVYDVDKVMIDQIIRTYKEGGEKNLGILLQGMKGQGKSLTAKMVCMKLGLPVIMINQKIPSDINFSSYLNAIRQDIAIFVDEFEKLFPAYENDRTKGYHLQNTFLTLMDGVYSGPNKKIFILTANDEVEDKLVNRPSRVRYLRKYNFMDPNIFDSVIADELKNKKFEQDLRDNLPIVACNMDLLREVIAEINLHDIPYSQFKTYFNFKPKLVTYHRFKKKGVDWIAKDTVEHIGDVDINTNRIADFYGCKVTDITKDGAIIYQINERTESLEGAKGPKTRLNEYKLVKKDVYPFTATKITTNVM